MAFKTCCFPVVDPGFPGGGEANSPERSTYLLFGKIFSGNSVKMKKFRPRDFLPPVKVMLSQVSVCPQGGVCHTPGTRDRHPPGQTPPLDKTPGQTPPGRNPLGRHPLPSACWDTPPSGYHGIWLTSGRYASYQNAFLFFVKLKNITRRALFLCHSKRPMFLETFKWFVYSFTKLIACDKPLKLF